MMEKCGMTRSLSFLWRDAKVVCFFLTKFSGGFYTDHDMGEWGVQLNQCFDHQQSMFFLTNPMYVLLKIS